QAKATRIGGMTVRKRIAAAKTAARPMAPVGRGWVTMTPAARSIWGCQNRESNIAKAPMITAQKKIQKTSANGLNLKSKSGDGISGMIGASGALGGIRPLGSMTVGAMLFIT